MAELIPSYSSCVARMQAGERRFAQRLASHLEDDYRCWYEIPLGRRQRYSDFIILHPLRGLLLLEVKDWKLDTIQRIDRARVSLLTSQGLKVTSNPLEQARQCAYQLVNRLVLDPQLVQHSGAHQGNLVFAYGYGVVLSNITRKQFDATDLGEVMPEHQVICKDEMTESTDIEAFQQSLWNMFNVQFATPLSLPQIDRIRWHLFPEIRVNSTADLFADEAETSETLIPDIVQVMDKQQELLAKSLGEGHRVIHGVAGSGKTLILAYRCLHLARHLNKPILVLCYNITLAARLREMIDDKGISHKVNVYHFHDWCGEQRRSYHLPQPPLGEGYFDRLVEAVINGVERGQIPKAQYGAVLIDEGHDFKPEWLSLVVGMVDPDTNSFLLLYDDAQSIYHHKDKPDFSLSSVGIQARGRTSVLKMNYRNTDEILHFAYRFAQHYLIANDSDEDHVPLLQPESVGHHGPEPVVKVFDSVQDESHYIAHLLKRMHHEKQLPWQEMCITYRYQRMGKEMEQALIAEGLPFEWLDSSQAKKAYKPSNDTIKLMTMHSSKGLEFPLVVVAGCGSNVANSDEQAEAKLLYVAMTRSTERLLVTAHQHTPFLALLLGD